MNKYNSYLIMMLTKEKRQKELAKKNIKLINCKYINEKAKDDNIKIIFTQKNSNKRNFNLLNNKETLSGAKTSKRIVKINNNTVNYDERTNKDFSMVSFYDGTHNKMNINKNNSIAYTKKRPNDLIKNQNLNRSTIVSKYSNSNLKINGRCFSCTNIKNKANILVNDNLKRNVSFYKGNITSTKNELFQEVNPFEVNNFSFKNRDDFLTRKVLSELINTILNIMKKRLLSIKIFLFRNMKNKMKMNSHIVSHEEYKLLEELKSLGVNNKKELNQLLKDIYFEITGKNYKI